MMNMIYMRNMNNGRRTMKKVKVDTFLDQELIDKIQKHANENNNGNASEVRRKVLEWFFSDNAPDINAKGDYDKVVSQLGDAVTLLADIVTTFRECGTIDDNDHAYGIYLKGQIISFLGEEQ